MCFDGLPVLVLGRVLGGVALTLLWTAFESWAVAEYNARGLARSSLSLGAMLGQMTTSKCVTAVAAGVLGHCVVLVLGSKIHPFIFSVVRGFVFFFITSSLLTFLPFPTRLRF